MSKVKLGTVADMCLGKMLDAQKNKGEYEPYLANVNVRWGDFSFENLPLMRFEPHEQERYGLKYGDLVMCEGGEPGRCAIWRDEVPGMKIQKALHRIRPHECLDVEYLYYWFLLAGKQGLLNRHFTETTIKHLPGDSLKDVEIDFPDLSTQRNIGAVLSTIDAKIRHNNSICVELESMAKTIYDYWFTQFDFPNAESKPYRSSGGKMVWNEQLKRDIPEGWEVVAVDSVLDRIPNTTRIQTSDYLQDGKLPIIDQSADFIAGFTNDETALLQSEGGFVVFGDHTRIVKYIRFPFARGADGTQVLKSNTSRMPDELLYQVITRIDLSNYGYARHFKFLKDSLLMLPDEIIAQRFKELVVPMHEQQVKRYFENIELSRLRDWLLPMLMNGQATIDVE